METAEKTMNVRSALKTLEIGKTLTFPIAQLKSIRAQASELGLIHEWKYKTATNRAARTMTVTRVL